MTVLPYGTAHAVYIPYEGGCGIWVTKQNNFIAARVKYRKGLYIAKAKPTGSGEMRARITMPAASGYVIMNEDHTLGFVIEKVKWEPFGRGGERKPSGPKIHKAKPFATTVKLELADGELLNVGDEVSVSYYLDTHPGKIAKITYNHPMFSIFIQTYECEPAVPNLPDGHQDWRILWDKPRRMEVTYVSYEGNPSITHMWPGFIFLKEPGRRFKDWEHA